MEKEKIIIPEKKHIIVPPEISSFLEVENCNNFNYQRYYVTEDVQNILNQILTMRNIVEEMKEYNIDYINSTLLYGESGTGKTTVGRYIAYALDLDFAYINFAKMIDGAFGKTAKNLSDVFRFIAKSECVFMMDEIDCIAVRRDTASGAMGGELSRVTITLMQELDNLKKHNVNSVLIGATNRDDMLDEALLSRFAIKYHLAPINIYEKKDYIEQFLTDTGIPFNENVISSYVSSTSGVTMREIESDLIRGIANWIQNGKKEYYLEHIQSQ